MTDMHTQTDEEFAALGPSEARRLWLDGASAKERERLHGLYLSARSIDLTGVQDDGSADPSSPISEAPSLGSLAHLGWGAMLIGLALVAIGMSGDVQSLSMLIWGGAAINAGFLCVLFGAVTNKLGEIITLLKKA